MIIDLFTNKSLVNNIDDLVNAYKHLSLEESVAQMTADGVAKSNIEAALSAQHYTDEAIAQAIATNATNVAKDQNIAKTALQTAGNYALAASTKVVNAALTMGASIIVSLLATKFLEWLSNVITELIDFTSKVEKSTKKVNDLNTEIESINKELKTTADRIDELNGKKNLSFTEQEELARLKEQNEELERELVLKERLKELAANTARNDAVDYFGKTENYASDYEITGSNTLGYAIGATVIKNSDHGYGDQIDKANAYLETYKKVQTDIQEKENEINDIKLKNPENYENLRIYKNATKELDALKKKSTETETELTSLYDNFSKYDDNLSKEKDGDLLNRLDLLYDALYNAFGIGDSPTDSFNDIWDSEDFEDSRKELEKLALAGELDGEVLESNEEYKKLIEATGKSAEETAEHINSLVNKVENTSADPVPFNKSEMISAINALSEGFESLDKIMESQKDDNPFDYALLDDKNFKENFSGLGKAYEEFVETISNSPKDVKACQEAYNNLVTEWINGKGILEQVTESTADVTEAMLKNMGVANASELVSQALENQALKVANAEDIQKAKTNALALEQLYASETGYALMSSSWGVISAFADEQNASELTIQALAQLKLAQLDLANNPLNLDSHISEILTLAKAAKVGAKYVTMLKEMEYWQGMEGSFAADRFNQLANELNSTNGEWAQSEFEFKPVEYSGAKYTGGVKTNGSGSSGSDPKEEEIDWIERRKEILQRLHDVQEEIANDETKSYQERANAIDYLIEKDKERVEVAKNAVSQYENAWKEASANLTEQDKKYIQEGGDIVKKYNSQELVNAGIVDSLEAGEEYIENLKLAQDCYDKMIESQKEELAYQKESIEHQKEKIQILRDQIAAQQDLNDAVTGQINSQKELSEVQGEYIGQDYYEDLIQQSKKHESLIQEDINKLYEQLDLTEEESAERYQILAEIEDCKNELIQCQVEQAELNDTIMRLPIERLQMFRDLYADIIEDMDNYRNIQEKLGLNPTQEELQTYIDLYSESIDSALKQQSMLKDLLDNYSYGSDKFNETCDEIQSLDTEINNLIASQIELNNEMLQISITKMSEQIDKLGNTKTALQNSIAEDNANGLKTSIDQYKDLHSITLQQLGLYAQQKEELTKLLGVYDEESEYYKETEQQITDIENEMSNLVQETYQWNQELLNIPIENLEKVNENLSTYSSILDGVLSDYSSALDGVNTLIDNEIDGVQDILDALNQQNEARKIQLNLEQSLYNLRRAEEQKTTKVIRNGEVQYEANQDDLRSAQQELADAQYDKMVYDLEQQIEALEEIKEKWQDIIDKIEEAKNLQAAEDLFGSGWQDSVLADSADLRDLFQSLYESTSQEKEAVDKQIESNERMSQMMNEFVSRYQEGSLTYEEALNGINNLISSMEGGYSAFEQLNGMMNLDNIASLGDIASSAEAGITGAAELLEQYLGIVESNKQSVEGFETDWESMSEGVQDIIDSFNVAVNSMDGYISVFQANAEAISDNTKTWEEMKSLIKEQVDALKKAAEELERQQKSSSKKSSGGSSSSNSNNGDGSYIRVNGTSYSDKEGSAAELIGKYGTDSEKEMYQKMRENQINAKADKSGDEGWREAALKALDEELKEVGVKKYHKGIIKGPVGFSPLSNDDIYKFAKRVATNPLKTDEVAAILQKGELVTQPDQMSNIMRNNQLIGQMAAEQASSAIRAINNITRDNVIDCSIGEIHLHEVQNVDEFAKALSQTFASSMQQNFSKVFKK